MPHRTSLSLLLVAGCAHSPGAPVGLRGWIAGDPADAVVEPSGPLAVIAGGGEDVAAAMDRFLAAANGGDVVVLRTSGSDGYNDWLYADLGGVDSVETLLVKRRRQAEHPWVANRLAAAEGIFLAGGDQWTYLSTWRGTPVEAAIRGIWARGGAIGGTSAGAMVQGSLAFTARYDSVTPDAALADPTRLEVDLGPGFAAVPLLDGVLVDTHVAERGRPARMLAFVARAARDGTPVVALGVDEATAVLLPSGDVVGAGGAHVVVWDPANTDVVPGPLTGSARYGVFPSGTRVTLPDPGALPDTLSATDGALNPR